MDGDAPLIDPVGWSGFPQRREAVAALERQATNDGAVDDAERVRDEPDAERDGDDRD